MVDVIKLHEGDERCETLLQALKDLIYERAIGMPMPLIIGTIELMKHEIIKEQQ